MKIIMELIRMTYCVSYITPIIVFLGVLANSVNSDQPEDCITRGPHMTCQQTFPASLPDGIYDLTVFYYGIGTNLTPNLYKDLTYENLIRLEIYGDIKLIEKFTFKKMSSLKYLGLHSERLEIIDSLGLSGITKIENLDFSDCLRLDSDNLFAAISFANVSKLNALFVRNLNRNMNGYVKLNEIFIKMIKSTSIKTFDVSGSNIQVYGVQGLAPPYMESSITFLNISNIVYLYGSGREKVGFEAGSVFLKRMKTLDASYFSLRFLETEDNIYNLKDLYFETCARLPNIENLIMDHLDSADLNFINVTFNSSRCNDNITSLYLRKNNFKYIDIKWVWPKNNKLATIDISDNGMEYLSGDIFTNLDQLETLSLSGNELHNMEGLYAFERLFYHTQSLKKLMLSDNKLWSIPVSMFTKTPLLVTLDLSNNNLHDINFDLKSLKTMRYFNLKNNKIKFISGDAFTLFYNFYNDRNKHNLTLEINLEGNPHKCCCESVDYIKWLDIVTSAHKRIYTCQLGEHEIQINKHAVDKASYMCIKTTVIVASSISSGCLLVIILIIGVFLIMKIRKNISVMRKQEFKRQLSNEEDQNKKLAFIAYNDDTSTPEEDKMIMGVIINTEKTLTGMIGVESEMVYFPDRNFHPGCSRADEIDRCIQDSYVVVVILSETVEDNFTFALTVDLAKFNLKPLILIANHDHEFNNDLVKECMKKFKCVYITNTDDGWCMEHGWDQLCDFIINLAVDEDDKKRNVTIYPKCCDIANYLSVNCIHKLRNIK